ncbi:hypothetical protein BFP70_06680 [Thioclava sp. SK-1]|uniref:FAD-dependent oxidoreductase n=1 Tax=Thioclava sp. SK-1 TaxID=1889770 RepID=UPI000824ECC2|nr:bifunctional TVP38/TMEM64 family protein/FAD-dependent oxidoreductase [Thioclava sp. SK-1]OCX65821.1 hypothetical protein BFP70_06680 [Thioclava sp. SK-1]
MRKPMVFIAVILVAVAASWTVADPSIDGLRDLFAQFNGAKASHPMAFAGGFFAIYVAVTALSLPFATWLTVIGGALFGLWGGLALVSFASTIGATAAFLVSRYLMGDWVRARYGEKLAQYHQKLETEGPFVLFSLRLIPVVPFFVVNLIFGLVPMPAWRFYAISQIAMLPATAVFVFAGTQLAQISSLSDIVQPGMLAAFVALGVLPWAARAVVAVIRRRKALSGYTKPKVFDRNLIVIGAGAGGLVASYVAAAAQAKVTLIEAGPMGGDCLNTGCVPSKALISSARATADATRAARLGVHAAPCVDFPAVTARLRDVIDQIAPNDSVERYSGLGVEVIQGYGQIIDPWTVEVHGARLTTRSIIVATGAAPVIPPISGINLVAPMTSETFWPWLIAQDQPPQNLLILGGGPIGCELAQALARLGAGVTVIEAAPRLIAREEPEASQALQKALLADGVTVKTGAKAAQFGKDEDGTGWVALEDGTKLRFDALLVAAGRAPRLTGFGLEALGLIRDGSSLVNSQLQSAMPHILFAGDVSGGAQLTNAAGHQGWIAAANALARPFWRFRADAAPIPAAVFTAPEIARVGLTQAQANKGSYDVTTLPLGEIDRAVTEGEAEGLVKILTQKGRDKILGVTVVGPHAAEILPEFTLAMRHGLGLGKILSTPHIYPSWSEGAKNAAGRWRQAQTSPRLLALAARFMAWRRG